MQKRSSSYLVVDTPMCIDDYREMKLEILDDFKIKLTDAEIAHVSNLKTEVAIDNFCISAINRHWN